MEYRKQGTGALKTGQCNLCADILEPLRKALNTKLWHKQISQNQAAGEIGIHRNTLAKFLHGSDDILVLTVMKIQTWVEKG